MTESYIIKKYIHRLTSKTKTELDDVIISRITYPLHLTIILIGLFFALKSLTIINAYDYLINKIAFVVLTLIISFILDLIPQFFSPFVALTTGILAGINIHIAILSVIIGSTVGSLIGFFLGKKYMFSLVDCLVKQNQEKRFTFLINKYGVL